MSSREQFEAWYMDNWGFTEDDIETLFERSPDCPEDYYRLGVRLAHHSWQAATSAIEAKCAALAAEKEKFAVECAATKIAIAYLKSGRQDFTLNTPTTDAFLADARAQGVEMCAAEIQKQAWECDEGEGIAAALDAMELYSTQLRNGGAV